MPGESRPGVAVGALLSACSSLLLSLSVVTWQVAQDIVFWMMGGLDSRTWTHVWISAPFILLALAAGLTQVLDDKRYSEIIMTRVTVPIGEDIGFLPGTEEEKMTPWMGALEDNLDVLNATDESGGEWGRAATRDLVRSRIKVKSLNFMRGRTFLNKWLIIDEAQNLTPKQMKTLVTRAGPGTKVVCLGNIAQIDTPYLTEGSSGLTYVVDRMKAWGHAGHVTLARGERSRLADHAAEVL